MKIFLLGLPGSGKSTLGRQLATGLKVPFVDLDHEIVKQEGKPIPQLFSEKGEEYFRQVESGLLKQWAGRSDDFVMATGGGAPCFLGGIDTINSSGTSVFLDVPPAEIARRMARTRVESRPTVAPGAESLEAHMTNMRTTRLQYYRQAHHVLAGTRITAAQLIAAIESRS